MLNMVVYFYVCTYAGKIIVLSSSTQCLKSVGNGNVGNIIIISFEHFHIIYIHTYIFIFVTELYAMHSILRNQSRRNSSCKYSIVKRGPTKTHDVNCKKKFRELS